MERSLVTLQGGKLVSAVKPFFSTLEGKVKGAALDFFFFFFFFFFFSFLIPIMLGGRILRAVAAYT